jgi:hypothetical protein
MKTFYGIVEDRQDPLKVGRVRVRCHGIHTANKAKISTPDLPWAQVLLPTTSAGLSGFGTQHGLVEGSTVFGFFRDGDACQQPVIIGTAAGIPQAGYKEGVDKVLVSRKISEGFNDPRALTVKDYEGQPDGTNPDHSPQRGFGLTTALDTAPTKPEKLEIKYDGEGSEITNPTVTELPKYPLYVEESDLSKFARGEGDYTSRDTSSANGIPSKAKPVYPYNKVLESESGHVLEIDDTLDAERIAVEHRSGTFHEIHPDGSQVTRVVNDNYTVVCKDDEVYVGGKVNVKVLGDATFDVGGDAKITVAKTTAIESTGNLSVVAPQISLDGTVIKLNS